MSNDNQSEFQKENPKEQVKELLSMVERDVLNLSDGDVINTERVFSRVKNNLRTIRTLTEAYMSSRTKW